MFSSLLSCLGIAFFLASPPAQSAAPLNRVERTVTFAWDPPGGKSHVLGYKIYWGTGNGNYQRVRELKPVPQASLSLSSDAKYYVAVSAYNMAGESKLSNQVVVPPVRAGR